MDEIIEVQKLEVSMGSNTATEKVCELRSPFAILLGLYCSYGLPVQLTVDWFLSRDDH